MLGYHKQHRIGNQLVSDTIFLQLIVMSSRVSSRSQACNTHSSLDKLGAINKMSSA